MALPVFPLINGNRYDYSSVEILVNGVPYRGIKAIDYKDSLDPAKQYGTSARAVGRTRGKYDASGSFEIFKEDAVGLRVALAALGLGGYGESNFVVLVNYSEASLAGGGFVSDVLSGCRVKDVTDTHAAGNEGITEKWTLDIMDVLRNGVSLLSIPAFLK
jgi:hypothetical protein